MVEDRWLSAICFPPTVFIDSSVTYGFYQDSSLLLRMTVSGGKARNVDFIFIAEGDTTTL
jgi:hypothetical protein